MDVKMLCNGCNKLFDLAIDDSKMENITGCEKCKQLYYVKNGKVRQIIRNYTNDGKSCIYKIRIELPNGKDDIIECVSAQGVELDIISGDAISIIRVAKKDTYILNYIYYPKLSKLYFVGNIKEMTGCILLACFLGLSLELLYNLI